MQAVVGHERHEPSREKSRPELPHPGGRDGLAGLAVGNELDCPEDSRATDLTDDVVLGLQLAKAGAQNVGSDGTGVLDDAFVLHRGDGGDDAGGRERVAGVREAAGEDAVIERFRNVIRDQNATDGDVPRVDSLRERNQVGDDVEGIEREPLTGSTEAGHDLVEDEDDSVLVGEGSDALEEAGRGSQDSRGAGNRFEKERRDRVGALGLDDAFEVVQGALGFLFRSGRPVFAAIQVGSEHVQVTASIFVGDSAPIARRDDGRPRVAVIRAIERDDLVAARVDSSHTNRVFDRIGATVGEEHLVKVRGGVVEDFLGGESAHVVRVGRCNGGEDIGLRLYCLDDLGVLVSDVDVDEHAREVEVRVSLVIPDLAAFTAGDHKRRERRLSRPRVEHRVGVGRANGEVAFGGAERIVHATTL